MKEDGVSSVYRSLGTLAKAFIPWALAIGATAWLGFYVAIGRGTPCGSTPPVGISFRGLTMKGAMRAEICALCSPPRQRERRWSDE